MNNAARVTKNSLIISFTQGISHILQIVFFGLIGRYLGLDGYGQFFYIYSFIMIFEIMSDLGLRIISVREIAKEKEDASIHFGNAIILKIGMSIVTLGCVFLISKFSMSPNLRTAFYIAGFVAVTQSATDVCAWVFRGFERMEYEASLLLFNKVLLLGLAILVINLRLGLAYFFYAILLSNLIRILAAISITTKRFVKPRFELDVKMLKSTILQSVPLGIASLLPVISRRSNIFLIKLLRDSAEVGLFSSAFVLIRSLMFFATPFVLAAFPLYSRLAGRADKSLDKSCEMSFKLLTVLGIPVVIGIFVLSDQILSLIFGDKFLAASGVIKILGVSLIFSFYNFLYRHILSAIKMERLELFSVISCLIINLVLAMILIPLYGYIGAGIALLVAEISMFVIKHFSVSKTLSLIPIQDIIFKPVMCGLVMIIVLFLLRDINIILLSFSGAAAYLLSIFLLNTFSIDELNIFKKALNWRTS